MELKFHISVAMALTALVTVPFKQANLKFEGQMYSYLSYGPYIIYIKPRYQYIKILNVCVCLSVCNRSGKFGGWDYSSDAQPSYLLGRAGLSEPHTDEFAVNFLYICIYIQVARSLCSLATCSPIAPASATAPGWRSLFVWDILYQQTVLWNY